MFDEHTIRICCFSGASDISPYDRAKMEMLSGTVLNTPLYLNFANCRRFRKALFPPPASFIVDLLERGFHDAKDFILSNDLIQCNSCYDRTALHDQPIFSKFSPTISPSATPSISPAGSYLNLAGTGEGTGKGKKRADKSDKVKKGITNMNNRRATSQLSFSDLLNEKLSSYSPDSANELDVSDNTVSRSVSDISRPNGQDRASSPVTPFIVIQAADQDADSDNQQQVAEATTIDNNNNPSSSSGLSSVSCGSFAGSDELVGKKDQLSSSSSSSSGENENPCKRVKPNMSASERYLANRRNTIQDNSKQLSVLQDRFTLAPNPLPSCPPSPNLNRHCTECIRMRQEARMDLIEEEIKKEAEKYRQTQLIKEGGIRSKLRSPIKWIRQLGVKSSYKFVDDLPSAGQKASPPVIAM